MKSGLIGIMATLLISLLVFITMDFNPDTDTIIEDAIKLVNKTLVEVKKKAEFADAKCYRDGDEKGIVMEFVYVKTFNSKNLDANAMKASLSMRFRNNYDLWRFAEMGIYYKFVYKEFSGNELCSFTFAKEDFKSISKPK